MFVGYTITTDYIEFAIAYAYGMEWKSGNE